MWGLGMPIWLKILSDIIVTIMLDSSKEFHSILLLSKRLGNKQKVFKDWRSCQPKVQQSSNKIHPRAKLCTAQIHMNVSLRR